MLPRTPKCSGRRGLRGFTLAELMIVVSIIGMLAAIAIPNFIKFQARSKQSEAKANLKALYTAEKAYFQEKDTFSPLVGSIGFVPERGNRYAYLLNGVDSKKLDDRSTAIPYDGGGPPWDTDGISVDTFKFPQAAANPGVPLACGTDPFVVQGPLGSFLAGAEGNIDNDPTIDQWSIASYSRVTPSQAPSASDAGGPTANSPGTAVAPGGGSTGTTAGGGATIGASNTVLSRGLLALESLLLPPAPPTNVVCDANPNVASGEPSNEWNDVNR